MSSPQPPASTLHQALQNTVIGAEPDDQYAKTAIAKVERSARIQALQIKARRGRQQTQPVPNEMQATTAIARSPTDYTTPLLDFSGLYGGLWLSIQRLVIGLSIDASSMWTILLI